MDANIALMGDMQQPERRHVEACATVLPHLTTARGQRHKHNSTGDRHKVGSSSPGYNIRKSLRH
jgi:hypothetical protein